MPRYTQGWMDQPTVCSGTCKPQCLLCPVADPAVARAGGQPEQFPVKT
jgi:A/G-specific adenine glycosylase